MSLSPQYTSTPRMQVCNLNAANTNLDGSGSLVTAFVTGTNGSRIESIQVKAISTTVADIVRVFVFNGTSNFLLTEIPVTAVTPSGTVSAFETGVSLSIILPENVTVKVSSHIGNNYNIFMFGGDF